MNLKTNLFYPEELESHGLQLCNESDLFTKKGKLIIDMPFLYVPLVSSKYFFDAIQGSKTTGKTHPNVIKALIQEQRIFKPQLLQPKSKW